MEHKEYVHQHRRSYRLPSSLLYKIQLGICHFLKKKEKKKRFRLNTSQRQVGILLSAAATNAAPRLCERFVMTDEVRQITPLGHIQVMKMTTVNKSVIKSSSLFVSLVAGSGQLSPQVRMIYPKSYKATNISSYSQQMRGSLCCLLHHPLC